jgi:uncharacterized membrane protein YidH (DUF202 family)
MREQDIFIAKGRLTMRTNLTRVAWIASAALMVAGVMLVALFPQPFITYSCANAVCPTAVSGSFSGGYVVIVLGLMVAAVAGIMTVVTMADHRREHQS